MSVQVACHAANPTQVSLHCASVTSETLFIRVHARACAAQVQAMQAMQQQAAMYGPQAAAMYAQVRSVVSILLQLLTVPMPRRT